MPSILGRSTLAVADRHWVRRMVTNTRPGRAIARRFVAGEQLADAVEVATELNRSGMTVSLDHLGEEVADAVPAAAARDAYLACLDAIEGRELDANISVKLTQLGLGFDDRLAAESLQSLAVRAADVGTSVSVDMEGSAYTAATVDLVAGIMAEHTNVGVALQAYLFRTEEDLDRLAPLGGHVRLCKGAYSEPKEIAFSSRRRVNQSYDRLLTRLMAAEGTMPAIATHDTARIDHSIAEATRRRGPWEFQMLYGVRPGLQRRLVDEGHNLRVYVPYGVAWYPYLTRRLAERPANLWFFLRAVFSRR